MQTATVQQRKKGAPIKPCFGLLLGCRKEGSVRNLGVMFESTRTTTAAILSLLEGMNQLEPCTYYAEEMYKGEISSQMDSGKQSSHGFYARGRRQNPQPKAACVQVGGSM